MTTLKAIKKQRNLTNAGIGRALGVSANVAGHTLQGRHISVMHDSEIEQLATILNITFERCWLAMVESINEFRGTPGASYQRADETRKEAQVWLQHKMPDVDIAIEEPRAWTEIEGVLVVPEERRIER